MKHPWAAHVYGAGTNEDRLRARNPWTLFVAATAVAVPDIDGGGAAPPASAGTGAAIAGIGKYGLCGDGGRPRDPFLMCGWP